MFNLKFEYRLLDIISFLLGSTIVSILWLLFATSEAIASSEAVATVNQLPTFSPILIVSAIIGAVGSYLAFGEDQKFPPSSHSVGHVLLNLGAGLFLTRGSLELMGQGHSSNDMIIFTSFLWSAVGYFCLRMLITAVQSDYIKQVLPRWVARIMGVDSNKGGKS